MVVSILGCIPLALNVAKIRMDVLRMFLNIPMQTIRMLVKKCEDYIAKGVDDKNELDSINDESFSQDKDNLMVTKTKNSAIKKRQFSNHSSSNP